MLFLPPVRVICASSASICSSDTARFSVLSVASALPQGPSDEPAETLLERIRAEKQRLIKEGKIKKNKHESVIFRRDNSHYEKLDGVERCIDDELPFTLYVFAEKLKKFSTF